MTKINFSSMRNPTFLTTFLIVYFSIQLNAQDSMHLQKAMQSCLEHSKIQPFLKAVSFEKNEDVLVVKNNELTPNGLKLFMFGKEALLLEKEDLFFLGIEEYVVLNEVKPEKKNITLTLTTGAHFTCTYSANKDKVIKLNRIELE